ncbi:MAG: helix-turn-helix transcriptional regulator [Gammaproteobacteria bacterium]|nr:helix-turn-helix transcriptional regulator [Gammaproteobacteria bacterium]
MRSLENTKDIEAIKEFHSGNRKTIPYKILQDIAKGKSAIKAFREHCNISQSQLAKDVGISRQYICQLENNERIGSSKIIKKIAEILDVDMDLLIS